MRKTAIFNAVTFFVKTKKKNFLSSFFGKAFCLMNRFPNNSRILIDFLFSTETKCEVFFVLIFWPKKQIQHFRGNWMIHFTDVLSDKWKQMWHSNMPIMSISISVFFSQSQFTFFVYILPEKCLSHFFKF